MLRVVHLSYTDGDGGAGRAALRIYKCIKKNPNIESYFYVGYKTTFVRGVFGPNNTYQKLKVKIRASVGLLISRLIRANKDKSTCSLAILPSKYPNLIKDLNVDLVHLHWVGAEFLSIKDIKKIDKPIIWTMHDMWPFSGARHIMHNEYIKKIFNYDEWVKKRKIKYWSGKKFYLVAPSKWMAEESNKSKIFSKKEVFIIPNPIDINRWKPLDKFFSRELMSLSHDYFYILFGAYNGAENYNKNFGSVKNNLEKITKKIKNLRVVVLQNERISILDHELIETKGIIKDDESMVALYNAVDMVIMPSFVESFGQMASEAQACGIPVLAYNSTGLRDIVIHKETGYLAEAYDEDDLIRGLFWIHSELSDKKNTLRLLSREHAKKNFSNEVVSKKYIELYEYVRNKNK